MSWLTDFRRETAAVIDEPFLRCLAEAIASVESANGRRPIVSIRGLNEIGYKAVPGKPSMPVRTQEALLAGAEGAHPVHAARNVTLIPREVAFRLFRDRREQADSLLWLFRASQFYESARLLFVLAFYMAYAPGRTDGLHELLRVFNRIAASGVHQDVRPFTLTEPALVPAEIRRHNLAAARMAVGFFAEITGALEHHPNSPEARRSDPLRMQ